MNANPISSSDSESEPRILYLIDEMVALSAGGTERQVLQMAAMIQQSGSSVELCALRGTEWIKPEDIGIPVHWGHFLGFSRFAGLAALFKLMRWMRSKQFDIVQTFFVESNLIGPVLARMAGVPVVLGSRRNLNYWMHPKTAFLQRISNMFATRLVANCEAVKRVVVQTEKIAPRKVDVMYNGIDLSAFIQDESSRVKVRRELNVSDSEILIGMVSNLRPVKGTDVFVEAAALVRQEAPHARFLLVGDGPLRAQLERTTAERGMTGCMSFAGAQLDVPQYLRAFDIAVLSSDSEGFSNSILEYIAMGLPTVATDVGGNAEALHGCGRLVPPKDPRALADQILFYVSNQSERDIAREKSLVRIQEFALLRTRKRLSEYYQRLLRNTAEGKAQSSRSN